MALPTKQQKLIETWQTSGLSQVAYCRQHKLNAKTFTNWLRTYREEQMRFKVPPMIPVEINESLVQLLVGEKIQQVAYFEIRYDDYKTDFYSRSDFDSLDYGLNLKMRSRKVVYISRNPTLACVPTLHNFSHSTQFDNLIEKPRCLCQNKI